MARFSIKYQTIQGKTNMGTKGTLVNASTASEARQVFKSTHIDIGTLKYKIISVVKSG